LSTLETVAVDTPAVSAIWAMVTLAGDCRLAR
jgi:hypothetical protein